jgi:hypothetical protein
MVNRYLAFVIGFNACVEATIKPYALLMIVVTDLYWLITKRKLTFFRQPEIYGAACFAALFIIYAVIINPQGFTEYLTVILPALNGGYDAYYIIGQVPTLVTMVTDDPLLQLEIAIGLIAYFLAFWRKDKVSSLFIPLALTLWMAGIAFIVQYKQWTYHRIPIDSIAFMLFLLIIYYGLTRAKLPLAGQLRFVLSRYLWTVMLILLIIAVIINNDALWQSPLEASTAEFNTLIQTYTDRNDSVLVIDTQVEPSYPSIVQL